MWAVKWVVVYHQADQSGTCSGAKSLTVFEFCIPIFFPFVPDSVLHLLPKFCRNLKSDHRLIGKLTFNDEGLFVYRWCLQHSGYVSPAGFVVASHIFFTVYGVRAHTQDGHSSDLWGILGTYHLRGPVLTLSPLEEFLIAPKHCRMHSVFLLHLRFRDSGSSNDFQLEIQPWTWFSLSFRS